MPTLPLSITPEERAEARAAKKRRDRERFLERRHLADSMTLTLADIEYALVKHRGNISEAAKFLGTRRDVLRRKVDMTPSLRGTLRNIREEFIDLTESKLMDAVEAGYWPAVSLVLKTLGKDRGYSERSVLEHEISEKGIRDAASLIDKMRKSLTAEELKVVEIEDSEWEVVETHLLPMK